MGNAQHGDLKPSTIYHDMGILVLGRMQGKSHLESPYEQCFPVGRSSIKGRCNENVIY